MNLEDFDTLKLAQDNPVVVGRMTSPDMVVSLLTEYDSTLILLDKAKTDPKAAGFLLALNGAVTAYNVITGHVIGDKQQSLLAWLVHIEAVTQGFMDSLIVYANPTVYPYANKTEHDFAKSKGLMVYAQVTPINGWLKITTATDCEAHRPQIYAETQGVKRRVAGFDVVSAAGDYLAQVPGGYATFDVDDHYGVVG